MRDFAAAGEPKQVLIAYPGNWAPAPQAEGLIVNFVPGLFRGDQRKYS
jgi:hypothetical protein